MIHFDKFFSKHNTVQNSKQIVFGAYVTLLSSELKSFSPYPSALDFWKIKFEKSSSTNWIFNLQKLISKLIFAGYTGSKNPIRNRLKFLIISPTFTFIWAYTSVRYTRVCIFLGLDSVTACFCHTNCNKYWYIAPWAYFQALPLTIIPNGFFRFCIGFRMHFHAICHVQKLILSD